MKDTNFTECFKENCDHANWVLEYIDSHENFPIPGVTFKWYSALLKNPTAFKKVISIFAHRYQNANIDAIIGLDSRGFIFATALAYELNLPLVLIRKSSKLPGAVLTSKYSLQYGNDSFEIEKNILNADQTVLILDDILATGGTFNAACSLVELLNVHIHELACFLELIKLEGRKKVSYPVFSIAMTDGD